MDIDGNIRFPPGKRPKKRGPNQQALTLFNPYWKFKR
jgi:hypothetical protein